MRGQETAENPRAVVGLEEALDPEGRHRGSALTAVVTAGAIAVSAILGAGTQAVGQGRPLTPPAIVGPATAGQALISLQDLKALVGSQAAQEAITAAQRYLDQQRIPGKTRNDQGNFDFSGARKEYTPQAHRDSQYLAQWGRVWTYSGLGVATIAYVKQAEAARARGDQAVAQKLLAQAKELVETAVRMAEREKALNGRIRGWRFSWNTSGDDFIDPRMVTGANMWVLKGIYAYIEATGDTARLRWANDVLQEFLFPLQVMTPNDPRYGLFRAGYQNPVDYAKGDAMGYGTYRGNPLVVIEHLILEHNWDALDALGAAAVLTRRHLPGDRAFADEAARRFQLASQRTKATMFRAGPPGEARWATAMGADGTVNWSEAYDNPAWDPTADVNQLFLNLKRVERRFLHTVTVQGTQVTGLRFFEEAFSDPYVTPHPDFGRMVSPEATLSYVVQLARFARMTAGQAAWAQHHRWAIDLAKRLYHSMLTLKGVYGGKLPYATIDIQDFFTTMAPSLTSEAWLLLASAVMEGVAPETIFGMHPEAKVSPTLPAPLPPALVAPTPLPTVPLAPATPPSAVAPQRPSVAGQVTGTVTTLDVGRLVVELLVPKELAARPEGSQLLAVGFLKTDAWYPQPGLAGQPLNREKGVYTFRPVRVDPPRFPGFHSGKSAIVVFANRAAFQQFAAQFPDGIVSGNLDRIPEDLRIGDPIVVTSQGQSFALTAQPPQPPAPALQPQPQAPTPPRGTTTQPAQPTGEFGVRGGKVARLTPSEMTLEFQLPPALAALAAVGKLGAVPFILVDTWYIQPFENRRAMFTVGKDGRVTVNTVVPRSPFIGPATRGRAVILVEAASFDEFLRLYQQAGAQAAGELALKIIVIEEDGAARVVDTLPRSGLEEAVATVEAILQPVVPSATAAQSLTVVAVGPSVFTALGDAERAKLTALVAHAGGAVVVVPEDQAARVDLLVDLSFAHDQTPIALWTYGAPGDDILGMLVRGAELFIDDDHPVFVDTGQGDLFRWLLGQVVHNLAGAAPSPIQLDRLDKALASLA